MLSLTFRQFAFDDSWESDEFYQLYVVKDSKSVLYVGISQTNVWDRWFGRFGGRMYITKGEVRSAYGDAISRAIVNNLPESLDYKVDLYTVDDCAKFLEEDIRRQGLNASKLDIIFMERMMIQKLSATLNERLVIKK